MNHEFEFEYKNVLNSKSFFYDPNRPVHWAAHGRIFERPTHHGRPINGRGYPRVCPADPGVDPIFALLYAVIFLCFKNIYLTITNYNKLLKKLFTIFYSNID